MKLHLQFLKSNTQWFIKYLVCSYDLASTFKAIYDDEKHRVGSPRITKRLQASGYAVGRNRVARIMCQEGWRAKGVKKFKATTNSRHNLPVAPNLLQQNFEAVQLNEEKNFLADSIFITKMRNIYSYLLEEFALILD